MSKVIFTISVDIPDEKQAHILQKVTDYLGYQIKMDEQPNPQARKQFLEQKLKEHIKNIYNSVKANEGANTGRTTALAEANGEIG